VTGTAEPEIADDVNDHMPDTRHRVSGPTVEHI
jgi:hypothetical protein